MSNEALPRKIIRRASKSKKKMVRIETRVSQVSVDDGAVNNDNGQNTTNECGLLNDTEYPHG